MYVCIFVSIYLRIYVCIYICIHYIILLYILHTILYCDILHLTLILLFIYNLFKGGKGKVKLERSRLWQLDNSWRKTCDRG